MRMGWRLGTAINPLSHCQMQSIQQDRNRQLLCHGEEIYQDEVIGMHCHGNDLVANTTETKPLTNVRTSGTDNALPLSPPIRHTLEQALEFIEDDVLVEVTPESIRIRKNILQENMRKRTKK